MTSGRLHALFLLARALIKTIFKRMFGGGLQGLALFEANFEAEHLSKVDAAERADLPSFSRCIACGRCNRGDGARIANSEGAYPGTMSLMLASSRSLPDFPAASEALRWISDDELAEKERLCPAAVPMRRIAAFIRARS
jgi:succinate dehydrogenase/fumarate reductase-like Fe-S protein